MIPADTLPEPRPMATRLRSRVNKAIEKIREQGPLEVLEKQGHGRGLEIGSDILQIAEHHLQPPQIGALETIHDLHDKIALRQYETLRPFTMEPTSGLRLSQQVLPVYSMAVVGSGSWDAQMPAVFMGPLVAAEVAGVRHRWAFLEPDGHGGISPVSLHAARLGRPTKVFRAGGMATLVALHDGVLGQVPDRVVLVGGDRLVRAAHEILFGTGRSRGYGLVVLCDADAVPDAIVDVLSRWLRIEPYRPTAVVTTSKMVHRKLRSRSAPEPVPSWWGDFENAVLVHVSGTYQALDMVNRVRPDMVVLMGPSFEELASEVRASHVLVGRYSEPAVLAMAGSLAALGRSGVLDYLTIHGIHVSTPQTASRLATLVRLSGDEL